MKRFLYGTRWKPALFVPDMTRRHMRTWVWRLHRVRVP